MMYIRKPIIPRLDMDWFIACTFKTYKSCVKICDISLSLSLFFSLVLGFFRYHRVWCKKTWLEQWRINKSRSSPTAGNVCVGTMQKGRWVLFVFSWWQMPWISQSPKDCQRFLGLIKTWCGIFSDCYMYTGLKGEDCFDGWRVHTMEKKTGTNLEAFIGFRLIPKIVFERKRRRQPSETQKIAWQMNDIHWWNSFLGESIFRQRFSSFGFFFLR